MIVDKIRDGVVVSLAYRLMVEDTEVENITADDPMEYLHGAENIVPGLENMLTGKGVGDRFTVTLEPKDAYGEYDESNTETISREDIEEDVEPGMEVLLEDEEGFMFEALVKEVTADTIVLDFNPPLAGKTVTYEVEVISMREADAEELDHGHPHGYEDDLDDYEDEDEEDVQ